MIEVNDKHRVCLPSVMAQNTDCFGHYRIHQLSCDVTLTSRIVPRSEPFSSLVREKVCVTDKFLFFAYRFLKIFRIRRYMTQCTFIDICRFTTISKSLRVMKFWHKMAYFDQIMLCANIYITIKIFLFVNLQQIKLFLINKLCPNFKKYMVSKVFRHF